MENETEKNLKQLLSIAGDMYKKLESQNTKLREALEDCFEQMESNLHDVENMGDASIYKATMMYAEEALNSNK